MSSSLTEEQRAAGRDWIARAVLERGLSMREAWRRAKREGRFDQGYGAAQTAVNRVRAEQMARTDTHGLADRMRRLAAFELSRLERQKGPADLERLERLARTLAQIQRLSPSERKSDGSALLGLVQGTDAHEGATDAQTNDQTPTPEEGARLADLV